MTQNNFLSRTVGFNLCRSWRVCALVWGLACLTVPARAAEEDNYSALERSVLNEVLQKQGLELEPEPEGKLIEDIDVVRLEVFDHRDPVPNFFNIFHITTRQRVVLRELFFKAGDKFQQQRVNDSSRRLRDVPQLSLVLVVPVRSSKPGAVRVLVVTKDVWSLRLNSNIAYGSGALQSLLLNPSETNWLGTHTNVGALFVLKPDSYSLGAILSHPKILGTTLGARFNANVITNRETGQGEGSSGYFVFGLPQYSRYSSWAWATSVIWTKDIFRLYNGANLSTFRVLDRSNGTRYELPVVFERDVWVGDYQALRSYGLRVKNDLALGFDAERHVYRVSFAEQFPQTVLRAFERENVPVSDQRISPYLQLHAYRADFAALLDVETLSLQEDYRVGHDVLLRVYPASRDLGSTRDLLGIISALGYTVVAGDSLLRGAVVSEIEYARAGAQDAKIAADLRFVSPRWGGRLVLDATFVNRYRNYSNRQIYLGGNTRLRGYAPNQFHSPNLLAATAEFRSSPVDILSAQVGLAAFYDIADTPEHFDKIAMKQAAGVGVRVLFPQANRVVFRADWGVPLTPRYGGFPGSFFVTFGQAFDMPRIIAPSPSNLLLE